jgi:hypothetical protein
VAKKRKPHGTGTGVVDPQSAKPPSTPVKAYVALLGKYGTPATPSGQPPLALPHRRFGDRGADPDDAPLTRLVRYRDLEKSGIVRNRTQLERLVRDEGMPPGRMLSSKTRVWTVAELEQWLATRPLAGKRQTEPAAPHVP